jgi:hypothetical protein
MLANCLYKQQASCDLSRRLLTSVAEDRAVVLLGSLDHGSSDHRASKTGSEEVYSMLAELSMNVGNE